ncbi:serine/threonine-protein kinase [Streptomyces sp. BK239]|uniref:serine/threonine-protein kinase n=1 Tax=Streptomyces sp. BK239 TaxID=2512155 RepID=UPI00102CD5CE|nr:serine/threonine-protein kinase [Streptomyces sp. BK239]RZU21638.1 serine/threonine protein kinase [Streptomyces sp. BK239]
MEKLGAGDPQRIGGYRLLARLGAGGMGQVYLARSDRGRTVAVKLVRPELAAREEFRARFRQEVRNAQRVGGFWTAPVLDADTEAAVPWVATGYVAGPSLQQVVGHDHGPLPERSVRILAAGLAHALANIHAAGIVHRDLKPSNVMVTIEGPRVIDFGVARALETVAGDDGLTRTGAVVGSPGFMSPEQVRGERITPACDVFCLGSVLVYAATGKLPFGAADNGAHALMFRIAEEEPDLTGLPEGIADLVRGCLRKDPAARPSLEWILRRTRADETVAEGRSRDPWLPGALVAQLGRHAVRLLETENPETPPAHTGPRSEPLPPGPVPTVPAEGSAGRAGSGTGGEPGWDPGAGAAGVVGAAPGGQAGVPAHPAYGHPAQHPHPAPGYGYPSPQPAPYNPYADGPGPTAVAPKNHYDADGGDDPSEPPRRSRRAGALLVAVAAVVALAAGGSVYALMDGDDGATSDARPGASPSPAAAGATAPKTSGEPTATPSASASSGPGEGAVPEAYLGTWAATIDNTSGVNSRRLTLTQGQAGDDVLKLVADGDGYHCEFTADLARKPAGDGPLAIGPSTVTTGKPLSSCTPGAATEVTLLPDGRLQRLNRSTGEKLTYTRAG